MAGFSKKGKSEEKDAKSASAPDDQDASREPSKKRFGIKKLILILLILGTLGGGGFLGYAFFFKASSPNERHYRPMPLEHVGLPSEMLRFSFDRFPDLYDALVIFNSEVRLFDGEIARIEAIAAKYPEQVKIADKQKKVWEKGKTTLVKAFAKLEKPVKETYVLYQVNPAEGQAQIESRTRELTAAAQAAIQAAQEQTKDLGTAESAPPDGIIQGALFKIKKIFQ